MWMSQAVMIPTKMEVTFQSTTELSPLKKEEGIQEQLVTEIQIEKNTLLLVISSRTICQ